MLKFLFVLIILAILSILAVIIYASVTNFVPAPTESVYESSDKPDQLSDSLEYSLLIWNIGYAGLSNEADFFYDGGKNMRISEEATQNNLKNILQILSQYKMCDFILLQEVDIDAKRSYHLDELRGMKGKNTSYLFFFAKNYDVKFVPMPLLSPMGKVVSGLVTMSKFRPISVERYALPGEYAFPKNLFMLKRCFLVSRYALTNGKELIIVNLHNEAYDSDGGIRKVQSEFLKNFLLQEYGKGNYVVAGGDWNICPPNFEAKFARNLFDTIQNYKLPADLMSAEWKFLFSNENPTNRGVDIPYSAAKTLTTVIDFYLVSPNVEKVLVENVNLDFEYSDHNPVRLTVKLKN